MRWHAAITLASLMLPVLAFGQTDNYQNGFETANTSLWSVTVPA